MYGTPTSHILFKDSHVLPVCHTFRKEEASRGYWRTKQEK